MTAPEPARRPVPRSRGGDPAPGLSPAAAQTGEPHPMGALQEAFGNLGVVRRLADPAVQARLEVGAPDDDYEREADRVAASIMRRPEPSASSAGGAGVEQVQRRAEDDDKKKTTTPPQRAPGAAQKAAPKPPPVPKSPPPTPTTVAPPKVAAPKKPDPPKKAPEPPKPQERKRDDERVSRKPTGGAAPALTPAASRTIASQQGAGRPLPPGERSFFEPRFGRDLGGVRVHDDAAARDAARDISAQAFTYGQDVYFGAGRYRPGTESGRELLAHELAHTVQQRPGARIERRVQRVPTRRAGSEPAAPGRATSSRPEFRGLTVDSDAGPINLEEPPAPLQGSVSGRGAGKQLTIKRPLNIPGFKLQSPLKDRWTKSPEPFVKPRGFDRDVATPHETTWRNQVALDNGTLRPAFRTALERLINEDHHGPRVPVNDNTYYVLRLRSAPRQRFIGKPTMLARELSVPTWSQPAGQPYRNAYQIDHIRELQLVNFSADNAYANEPANLWLLDSGVNQTSGTRIDGQIRQQVTTFTEGLLEYYKLREAASGNRRNPTAAAREELARDLGRARHPDLVSSSRTYAEYTLEFDEVASGIEPRAVTREQYWRANEIENARHLRFLEARSVVAEAGHIAIFANATRVAARAADQGMPVPDTPASDGELTSGIEFDVHGTRPTPAERRFLPPLAVEEKHLTRTAAGGSYGQLVMGFPRGSDWQFTESVDRTLDVREVTGIRQAAVIDPRQAVSILGRAHYVLASPIHILSSDVEPGRGFTVRGQISADIPLLRDGIDFELAGDELSVYKQFNTGAFDVPAPLHVNDSSLVVRASTGAEHLTVTGFIDFGIDRVGSGRIAARAGTSTFALDGEFEFESDIFDPAHVAMHYAYDRRTHAEHFTIAGDIGLRRGRLRGVQSATLHVAYADGHLVAHGHGVFDIPGVREANLDLTYDREHGLRIVATVAVAQLPGLREGTATVTIAERPEGGYRVALHGEGTASIPGFETHVVIDYDDGAFLAQATLPINHGRLIGEITLGATNRPTDENNRPIPDAPPLPDVHIFGSGTASMQFGVLHGTATVRLLANGELEVEGTLSVPRYELWHEIAPPKEPLFPPLHTEFSIFGPVVIRIGGRIDREFGISAGVLSGSLFVHYNPAHEDQTVLRGSAHLHASAFAGLDLVFSVGIGLDAIVGSIHGDIDLGAEVKIEAAIDPSVEIDWTPTHGITVNAAFDASLTPTLRFHIDASITASLAWWSKTWGPWNLAQKEFGSGLQLGIHLPVHYDESQGLAVAWSEAQFTYPSINVLGTGRDILESFV